MKKSNALVPNSVNHDDGSFQLFENKTHANKEDKIRFLSLFKEIFRALTSLVELLETIRIEHSKFLNPAQAAKYLHCSEESLEYHRTRSAKLNSIKFSKEGWIVAKEDLDTFAKQSKIKGCRG